MSLFRAWCARHPSLVIIVNLWLAVWSANVVTTWAQTALIQADNEAKAENSVSRWKVNRAIVCDIAHRLNIAEQACARR